MTAAGLAAVGAMWQGLRHRAPASPSACSPLRAGLAVLPRWTPRGRPLPANALRCLMPSPLTLAWASLRWRAVVLVAVGTG